MVSRSKTSLHRRNAFLLAALFLTLTFAVRSQDTVQPPSTASAPPQSAPEIGPATPPPAPAVAPTPPQAIPAVMPATPSVTPLPATGGNAEPQVAPKGKTKTKTESKSDTDALVLPVIKPIVYDVDRDYTIGHKVGQILEVNHYLQTPINAEMSQRWLKNYLDALDYNHLFFLQSDVDEFTAKYGNNLGDLLLHGNNEEAAVAPAFEIFNRFMQRLNENVRLAEDLLNAQKDPKRASEKFDFTKDESYTVRTHKSPWIQDAAASAAVWRGQVKSDLLNGLLDKKTPEETIKRTAKRYASLLRDSAEDDDMDVFDQYLLALTHAYDPHSDYFSPEEAQNFNIQAIKHEVTGIGAVLRSDDGYATIEEVIPGGPADLDKRLQPGDRILAVGQGTDKPVDAVDMKLGHVVDMIRGRKSTIVHLIVSSGGAGEGSGHKDIVIKRDEVSIKDALAKAHIIEHRLPDGTTEKLGVIDLHDFYDKTATDVAKLVLRLKKEQVAGIILDMRSNGGGLLDQAIDLTGLFAKHEPVVQVRSWNGNTEHSGPEDVADIYDGPLVVMVNKMSASATEIVAAALQDYGRAVIVGDQSTHGKGTVQQLFSLDQQMPIGFPSDPGPGNLKLTMFKFYRVAGGSTQQKGVVPDIVLPSVLDALELGETTLPYYLPYDEVKPVPYTTFDLVAPYLTDLRENSSARVAASPDFAYVRQDIAYYKKKVEDSTISLNEATRLKEQQDLKALEAQRKKDLAARQPNRDKDLELTLDMVDQNLPAALPVPKKPKVDLSDDAAPDEDSDLNSAVNNPTDDPQLDETVNIMSDYTKMLHDVGSKVVQSTAAPIPAAAPAK